MQTNYKRDDESGKTIRNEVEIIILLYGQVVDYDYINSRFEISPKTFKREQFSTDIEKIQVELANELMIVQEIFKKIKNNK